MTDETFVIATGGVEIQDEVAKGSRRHATKHVQHGLPLDGKRLQYHVPHAQLIPGILEGHDVMGVSRYALGKFARRKHVLTQVEDRDVAMVGMFGENVQHRLVVVTLRHQIVHHQQSTSGEPFVQLLFGWYARTLPRPVTVMNPVRTRGKEVEIVRE